METSETIDPRWRWHHRTLLAIRRRLVKARAEHRADASAAAEPGGIVSADQASARGEREVMLAELDAEESELGAIDAALQRIRAGTYGTCLRTGQPISAARLRAIPWTPYSRASAEKLEAKTAGAASLS